MNAYVRTVRAHEGETVEVQWTLADGSVHIERYTVPPKSVREARSTVALRDSYGSGPVPD